MPILFVTLTTRTTNTHRKFVGAFAKNTELKKKKKNKKKAIGMPCSGYALPFRITISFVIGYIVVGVRVIDTNSSFSILKMVWSISVPATKQNGKAAIFVRNGLIAQVMSECVKDEGKGIRNNKTFQQRKTFAFLQLPTAFYLHFLHHFCNGF